MYDAELKDIITLINEEGYEYSAFLIKIMEYIIKNRSLVTKNDAIRADLQNKLSELYYKQLNPLMIQMNNQMAMNVQTEQTGTSDSNSKL